MEEEDRFRRDLSRSWVAVRAVAEYLHELGYTVQITGNRVRQNMDDREGYGDEYDLSVVLGLEIKFRDVSFTCADDYRYNTVFVDRVDKADKVNGKVFAYLSVNKELTHYASVRSSTRGHWKITTRDDGKKGYPVRVYECPKELATFHSFTSLAT